MIFITSFKTANGQPILKQPASENDRKNLTGIVYLFLNKINEKVYIGQHKGSFNQRYSKQPKNWYKHAKNPHFKNALQLFSGENFEIFILEHSIDNPIALDLIEITCIDIHESNKREFGYNKTTGGNKTTSFSDQIRSRLKVKRESYKDQFIKRAITIHGNRFDYSNIIFHGMSYKVENIKCNVCGNNFNQQGECHVGRQRQGCPTCKGSVISSKQRMKFDEFNSKASYKYNNEFIYDQISYKTLYDPVMISHKNCGHTFVTTAANHLHKNPIVSACPKCRRKKQRKVSKPIAKIDSVTGLTVDMFPSIIEAVRLTSYTHVGDAVRNGKLFKGFFWKYV